jgi:hypothetical protein
MPKQRKQYPAISNYAALIKAVIKAHKPKETMRKYSHIDIAANALLSIDPDKTKEDERKRKDAARKRRKRAEKKAEGLKTKHNNVRPRKCILTPGKQR